MIDSRYGSIVPTDSPADSVAFLLAQVGSHAAMRYAERIGEQGLTPQQTGVLGLLRSRPGLSQQELAAVLGMLPSRVVVLVDELESAGLVARVRDPTDRRRNALELTAEGTAALRTIGSVAREHDADLCSALSDRERATLRRLLSRIAAQQGLTPGVHPGYRALRPSATPR